MKGKRFLSLILLSATTAAMPAVRVWGQDAPAASGVDARELEQLRGMLFGKETGTRERDEAAKRLLQRGASEILHDALRSGDAKVQVPVARALSYAENPPAEFLEDLLRCLQPQIGSELADAVSLAAINYRDSAVARERVRNFILSGNVGENARESAVRALGSLNDKETAQFLVQTVLKGEDPRISQRLSDTAADALADMTGHTEYGRDYGQWNGWWASQQGKGAQEFLNDRLVEREAAARKRNSEIDLLIKSINTRAIEGHIPLKTDEERERYVLGYLNDQSATFRTAGAKLVKLERGDNLTVGPAVVARLRELIGDSTPEVRLGVADAIAAINDPEAAKPLLAQLQREKIPAVKAALIAALAPTKDVSTVPELIKLLNDPSFQVSEAAAGALRELGPEIAKNQVLSRQVSNALAQTIMRTTGIRGANRLRERAVEAMAPLKDTELVQSLFSLLEDRESNPPPVRIASIRALSSMNAGPQRQSDIAGRIADTLAKDAEKGVRLEAAIALGIVGGTGQKQALLNAMGPNERDEVVRDAAWRSISALFDQFDDVSLANLAEMFKAAPEKQLGVNLARHRKLKGGNQSEELAIVQESIGTLYLNPAIDKPDAAIEYLTSALAYWDGKGPGVRTENLQNNLLDADLRSKKYKDATEFALSRIKKKDQNQEPMGRRLLQEVDQLTKKNELRPALDLLVDVMALPIEGYYKEQFILRNKEIRGRILPFYDHYRDGWIGIFASARQIMPARG